MTIHSSDQNVYSFFEPKIDISKNMFFERNNWLKTPPLNTVLNQNLNNLAYLGVSIWLSSKGEFCYRTTSNSTIHTIPLRNTNIVLSNLLGYNIQIITKLKPIKVPKKHLQAEPTPIQQVTNSINIFPIAIIQANELLLVEEDKFAPLQHKEFFIINIACCRNTFLPSSYLQNIPEQNHQFNYSITLQYIYYLAKYNRERFYFIMNWLASFFKDLKNRSKIALVFVGNKESGKEIFFDEIIKPLFGQEYCLKITDSVLETASVQKLLKNKLFYNIDDLSDSILKDKKSKKIINDLLCKDTIEVIENKESIVEYLKYGQTIITIDEAHLTYIDKDFESYSLFKIPDESTLVEHFNPNQQSTEFKNLSNLHITSKAKLINAIKNDLWNFSFILKGYLVNLDTLNDSFENDDKKYIQNNLEDKLKAFHEAISKHKTSISYFHKIQEKNTALYEELISDFKVQRIKQKNLINYFSILYPEENITSSRTLMAHLRKVDNYFYSQENFKLGTAGIKYFKL